MERHVENALKVALHLKDHPGVAWVRYPGLPEDPQYEKAQKYLRGTGGVSFGYGIDCTKSLSSSTTNAL